MSGGSGGPVIIRTKIKETLNEPLCGGSLPDSLWTRRDALIAKDVNSWTASDDHAGLYLFNFIATHC